MLLDWIAMAAALTFLHGLPAGGEHCERLSYAQRAISEDPEEAKQAIAFLHAKGPSGLEAFLEAHRFDCQLFATTTKQQPDPNAPFEKRRARLERAFDGISGQKDNYYARLFWFTDFEAAKKHAQTTNKPILSLRLLGRLDEELSCANSRFFRTALYADPAISKFLRENFVLHWQSMRPVPKVTIDFGDGRKLERTITGNSIHYILLPDGSALDAIPGLYAPGMFLRILQEAKIQTTQTRQEHLQKQIHAIEESCAKDFVRIGLPGITPVLLPPGVNTESIPSAPQTSTPLSQDPWTRIAALHPEFGKISAPSIHMIRRKSSAQLASERSAAKRLEEDPLLRVIENFRNSIAIDTVRNEYFFRGIILRWIEQTQGAGLDQINERVYSELFLTPSSDPWLGLLAPDAYAAIDRGGIVECR